MNARLAALALLAAAPVHAQGFAGMGGDAEGFRLPERGAELRFPEDHGPHPEHRIEWWYLTANLEDGEGTEYGVQWTLFRAALAPGAAEGWASPQVWIGHAGLTSPDTHHAAERMARDGTGQAGVTAAPFAAWIDEWHMTGAAPDGADALDALELAAGAEAFGYRLSVEADGPLIFHGDDGYSVKSDSGVASYYYSQPHYRAEGVLRLPGGEVAVEGVAWLDREWSSQPLEGDQSGWDWFSLHLEGGVRLMAAQVREGAATDFVAGTWIEDDTATPLTREDLALTPLETATVAGRDVPVRWRIELPARDLDITTEPVNPDSWMEMFVPYWEGPVRASGSHTGRGFMELTGYE